MQKGKKISKKCSQEDKLEKAMNALISLVTEGPKLDDKGKY